ncbi:MAG: DUF5723 family protein [Bacteroidales bacterium]|nr:DUF5723 family protein [Bacteroidales bacterium]MCM1147163.1 DUF5723 family protein [Bacteroidales bacterium]MCM1205389.1 DUF5723 family protein [Bacillota bacterium]MCM1509806.1 DUF5723 family protein [Clostridium sp.]
MKLSHNIKYILSAVAVMGCTHAVGQTLNSAYFTEDQKFRHTLNPAFGNEQNYVSVPALGNLNVNVHGNFGYQDVVMKNPMPGGKRMTTFMNPYISVDEALAGFGTNNRVAGNVSLAVLSAGFKGFGGYNTVELNVRTSFGAALPYELFEFAKNTGNKNYEIGDVSASAIGYAELAFGHSRQINDKLRVGGKFKLLFGGARADVKLRNLKADLSAEDKWIVSGEGEADVSMKGFTFKSETKEYNDEDRGSYEYVNDVDVDGAGLGGFGMAVDLGGVYKINDDWTVSAALLDLGFIRWSNDMRAVNRQKAFEFDGFHDISVNSGSGVSFDDQIDNYGDQLADFANLTDEGDRGGRTTGIGATMVFGGEYTLPAYRKLKFGALSTTRINGDFSWTEGRISANYAPLSWLNGGVSFAVNSFTTSCGWILNIHPKGYNFFIGMDHILGKTSKEMIPLSSNASISLGMNITW